MVEDPRADAARWRVYGERTIYDSDWVRLGQVEVEPPGGDRWWHHVVRLPPIAAALVLDDQDRVLMLWRHRFLSDTFGWELPGGIIEGTESAGATAARETLEETGWQPIGPPEHLCTFEPMPGMVDARHEVYLFHGAVHIGEPTEKQETGRVEWRSLGDVRDLVAKGELLGAGSLVGLLYLLSSRGPES